MATSRSCIECLKSTCEIVFFNCIWWLKFRSSHRKCSIKIVALKNFTKFTGKHMCLSLFINKVAGLRPAILLTKTLWYRCFPVNFAKFLSTPFLQNTSGRVLLEILQLVHEIRSFPEVLYKRGILKKLLEIHRSTQEAVIRRCSLKKCS